jgi:N utilization substance protein A
MATLPRTEFAQALKAIASERSLDADVILDTIKHAIIAAYRRDAKELGEDVDSFEYDVEIDPSSGEARVFAWPEGEEEKREDVTPPGFGRIAAQTAKQVIHQKIREAEKGAIMDEFSDRIGTLISGMVLRFDGPDVRVDLGRAEGIMPASERVPNERLSSNQRYTFLLKDIEETPRGKMLMLSRTAPGFVVKLFEREVPEMASGSVEVRAIAREAGVRTKIAVDSNQSGVDPVGSCVGQKGVRVQAVTNELGGERVDIIPWSDSEEELIKASLSPAEGLAVTLKKKKNEEGEETKLAVVQAPEDQLSLAIGKDGQNARLAAKLTGYKIEIEGLEGEETRKGEEKDEPAEEKKDEEAEKVKVEEKEVEEVEEKVEKKKEPKEEAKEDSSDEEEKA